MFYATNEFVFKNDSKLLSSWNMWENIWSVNGWRETAEKYSWIHCKDYNLNNHRDACFYFQRNVVKGKK